MLIYFWKVCVCGGAGGACCAYLLACPLVQAFEGAGPAECRRLSSGRVFPPFVRFTALRLVHRLQIWLYFAFLGRF